MVQLYSTILVHRLRSASRGMDFFVHPDYGLMLTSLPNYAIRSTMKSRKYLCSVQNRQFSAVLLKSPFCADRDMFIF
jgi:hypothetical protein